MNSAIMRPRKSIYHWYTYYFPYSLVDNMNDLWEKFLCQDVEYLVVPEISAAPEIDSLVSSFGQKVMNADDRFEPWASSYIELRKAFTHYEDVHDFKLLMDQSEPLNAENETFFLKKAIFSFIRG